MKNDVAAADKYRIRLVIEELVQQILIPEGNRLPIKLTVEYSEQDERCTITVSYAGDKFDIRHTDNTLSLTMIENSAEEIEYFYEEHAEQVNVIKVTVRKNVLL